MVEQKSSGKGKNIETALPLSRIKTIMKSSVDTGQVSNEVLFVVAKSAEMFIQYFTKNAYENSKPGNLLKYEHLSQYVQDKESLEFLLQIVPQKIKVKEFKQILADLDNDDSDESESSSGSDDVPESSKPATKKNKK